MQSNQLTWRTFYQKLGHLFYAIAASDNKITPAEVAELDRLVKTEWVKLEDSKDDFGTDMAYQIEIVFDWLQEETPNPDSAFEAFSEFFKQHPHFFNEDLKIKVLNTAIAITYAFRGKNKSEEAYISRLKELLA